MQQKADNAPVYLARLHWILFFWPFMLVFGGMFLAVQWPELKSLSLVIVVAGLFWGVMSAMTYHFSSLTIKKNQVILRSGMLVRQTVDIPLLKIESIDIRQTLSGSLLRYGSLVITGTGGTRYLIPYLDKPLTCRRHIEQLLHG